MDTPDSFGGVNFAVLVDGHGGGRSAVYSIRHVAHGNFNILHRGGRGEKRKSLTVYVTSEANAASLEDLVDSVGTLIYGAGTFSTAYLTDVKRGEIIGVGTAQELTLDFILDAD